MLKQLSLAALVSIGFVGGALAAGSESHTHDVDFSFEGPFGTYDQNQLQRGLKIYTEVCAGCHGLKFVPMRTIADEGGPHLPEDQMKAYVAEFPVNDETVNRHLYDPETEELRALKPTDHFPAVASQAAPDLSLMAKARAGFHGPYGTGMNQLFKGIGGPEYIASLLTGYEDAPSCTPDDFPGAYNTAFAAGGYPDECKDEHGKHKYPGSWIGMAQPLYGDDVEFDDGHSTELHHEAEDIAAFLMWTAEPKLEARKRTGFVSVFFLTVLTVLLYLTNKRIWAAVKKKKED